MPETGQHIAFYSMKALQHIADTFNCKLYSNGTNLHLLAKQSLEKNPFALVNAIPATRSIVNRIKHRLFKRSEAVANARPSLLQKDFELYKTYTLKEHIADR